MSLPGWLAPLYDAAGMGAADRWASSERGIPSLELMEAAGTHLAEATATVAGDGPVAVVCGKGNNGGDGLVAARVLARMGHRVRPLLLWPAAELSTDAAANLERLEDGAEEVGAAELPRALEDCEAVIDAIFGTGFSGAPRSPALEAIEAINDASARVIACDIPSGVDASSGETEGAAVDADLTISFHAAKLGQRVAPGKWRCGEVRVVDIGIPDGAPADPVAGTIELSALELAPRRGPASTKFSSGQVVVVGGSRGMTGAVTMASRAAIRAGAGYATLIAPASLEPILEAKLTEVMTVGVSDRDGALDRPAAERVLERAEGAACALLGPGIGRAEHTAELARELAGSIAAPLVIDADGLNALGTDLGRLAAREHLTVLTPHAGELARLLGTSSEQVSAHRLEAARRAAGDSGAVVVLKGDDTIVTDGELLAVNALSSPALATAGTGDVLAGTIAALIARGMEPLAGAAAAVLAHARAGRSAARELGAESVVAGDVIDALPAGLRV